MFFQGPLVKYHRLSDPSDSKKDTDPTQRTTSKPLRVVAR